MYRSVCIFLNREKHNDLSLTPDSPDRIAAFAISAISMSCIYAASRVASLRSCSLLLNLLYSRTSLACLVRYLLYVPRFDFVDRPFVEIELRYQ